jgi:hypothetical protein
LLLPIVVGVSLRPQFRPNPGAAEQHGVATVRRPVKGRPTAGTRRATSCHEIYGRERERKGELKSQTEGTREPSLYDDRWPAARGRWDLWGGAEDMVVACRMGSVSRGEDERGRGPRGGRKEHSETFFPPTMVLVGNYPPTPRGDSY